jgi:hypothetical protein
MNDTRTNTRTNLELVHEALAAIHELERRNNRLPAARAELEALAERIERLRDRASALAARVSEGNADYD